MKIKEKLQRFGILVLRLLQPNARKKSVQRLGVLALGLALLGATQANTIRQAMSSATKKVEAMRPSAPQAQAATGAIQKVNNAAKAAPAQGAAESQGGSVNIVDLIDESELILHGQITNLADGFENGVPYTQVTLRVAESFRGQVGDEYTFRQFGLLKPRKLDNGKVYLGGTPAGWAKYSVGEEVVLFLYQRAAWTGLQTTVGLGQGKFEVHVGNVASEFGNRGLFEDVVVDDTLLNDNDKRMLGTQQGPVNKDSFISFVRRAAKGQWVQKGRMRHAK